MSIWYRTGTVTVTNGSKTVTGVDTTFNTSIYPGDLFTVDENVFYEVATVTSNLVFTLQRNYAGTTGSGKSYVVVPLSPKRQLTAELAARVNALIERYRGAIEAWTAGGWAVDTNGDYKISGDTDRKLVPIENGGGGLGTATKRWGEVHANSVTIAGQAVVPKTASTANATPVAGSDGKIADGWIPATVARTASPALTGSPTAPTQTASNNSTKIATTAYVKNQVASDTVAGMVELATSAETTTATDTTRAVTPAGFLAGLRGNILGTVSQSGGVPTGAVIERGSNANGAYVKFADGTMICTVEFSHVSCNTASGSIYISDEISCTFPATFLPTPNISAHTGNLSWVLGFAGVLTTNCSIKCARPVGSSTATRPTITAIGRWF